MSDAHDPFAFLDRPALENQIYESLDAASLRVGVMPGLYHLLSHGLRATPLNDRHQTLCDIVTAFRISQHHCVPYLSGPQDISQAFYCAAAMAHLPASGVEAALKQAGTLEPLRNVLWDANGMYQNHLTLAREAEPSADTFATFDPASQMMVELQATITAYQAELVVNAPERRMDAVVLNAIGAMERYCPLMGGRCTSMAGCFNDIAHGLKRHREEMFFGRKPATFLKFPVRPR